MVPALFSIALIYAACVGFYQAHTRRTTLELLKNRPGPQRVLRWLCWAALAAAPALLASVTGWELAIPIALAVLCAGGIVSLLCGVFAPRWHAVSGLAVLVLSLGMGVASSAPAQTNDEYAGDPPTDPAQPNERRYTYSWLFAEGNRMQPRGGTTKGPEISLATEPSTAWEALQEGGLADQERDRRAILAMAGAYRTSFDFIETIGFTQGYAPGRPYQSWGTEYVYVVTNEPDFVSLQHILVMTIVLEDGSLSDPMVIKHWRQDWTWQDRELQVYAGRNTWTKRRLSRREARGSWSQAVFQVDDSPRYETYGRWTHEPGYSHWESETTWRPLPRREFSVRDDYQALIGVMRISITPTSWVMEEDALKAVLDESGGVRETTPYLAREAGISRYEHIIGYDFSAGDDYWHRTGVFWSEVRDWWRDLFEETDGFALHKSVDGTPLFAVLFGLAEEHGGDTADPDTIRSALDAALMPYVR